MHERPWLGSTKCCGSTAASLPLPGQHPGGANQRIKTILVRGKIHCSAHLSNLDFMHYRTIHQHLYLGQRATAWHCLMHQQVICYFIKGITTLWKMVFDWETGKEQSTATRVSRKRVSGIERKWTWKKQMQRIFLHEIRNLE